MGFIRLHYLCIIKMRKKIERGKEKKWTAPIFLTASNMRLSKGCKARQTPRQWSECVCACGMRENGVSPAGQTLALAPSAENHANVG